MVDEDSRLRLWEVGVGVVVVDVVGSKDSVILRPYNHMT